MCGTWKKQSYDFFKKIYFMYMKIRSPKKNFLTTEKKFSSDFFFLIPVKTFK